MPMNLLFSSVLVWFVLSSHSFFNNTICVGSFSLFLLLQITNYSAEIIINYYYFLQKIEQASTSNEQNKILERVLTFKGGRENDTQNQTK